MNKNCHKIDHEATDQEDLAIIIKDEWICMMKLLHIIIKSILKSGVKTGIKLMAEAIK